MTHHCEEFNCFNYQLDDIPVCHDHLVHHVFEASSKRLFMFPKDLIRYILDCFNDDEVYYFVNKWNWIARDRRVDFAVTNGLLDLFKITHQLAVKARREVWIAPDDVLFLNPYKWDVQEILKLVISNKDLDMLKYLNRITWHLTVKQAMLEYAEEWSNK